MKRCGCCGAVKPLNEFHGSKNKPGGLANRCKVCQQRVRREWHAKNADKISKMAASYYQKNADKISKMAASYYQKNKKAMVVKSRMRDKRLLKRSLPSERKEVEKFYLNRPEGYHVDHDIPLVGKVNGRHVVCGLHVLANLQYLPAHENDSKGSKFNELQLT